MADPLKQNRIKTEEAAAITAGAGTFGVGMIDLRPRAKVKGSPHLGDTWNKVRGKIKPGDVFVGANRTAPEAFAMGARDALKYWKKTKGQGITKKRLKGLASEFDVSSAVSKFSDPVASHAAVMPTGNYLAHSSSGSNWKITNEIPINTKERRWLSKWQNPHYTVLRPKEGVGDIPDLIKKKGQVATRKIVGTRAGDSIKYYKGGSGVKNQILDWITPKFRRNEKLKSKALRKAEACTIGGTCGTTGASFTKTTVGGKGAAKVLPKDYLRSSSYDVVGTIGRGKTTNLSKAIFAVPKYTVKATAALGAAGLTYGAVKGYKKLKNNESEKITKTAARIYRESFMDELNKIYQNY